MKEMFANTIQEEYAHLTEMVSDQGWPIVKKLMRWHKANLNKKLLSHLDNGEIDKAQQVRGGMFECDRIINIVIERITALKNEITKE